MADHLGFVIAAYACTALLLLGTLAWVLIDYHGERRALDGLERTGRTTRGRPTLP